MCSVVSDSLQPMDYSPPGSPVCGILQARTLEFFTISFSLCIIICTYIYSGLPSTTTVVKNLPANWGDTSDTGLISGSGRSLGVGNSNPLQYSCLENFRDRGAWQAIVHWVTKNHMWQKCGIYIIFIHSSVDGYLHCFHILVPAVPFEMPIDSLYVWISQYIQSTGFGFWGSVSIA